MKILIVDGYNAIYKIPRARKMLDVSLSRARETITRIAQEYTRTIGGIGKLYIVFDGKSEYRGLLHVEHKTHVFSRDKEGDQEIIRLIARFSARYQVLVVSDDNYVRNNARAYRARVISVAQLAQDTAPKRRQGKDASGEEKRIDLEKAREINRHLKERWDIKD